MDFAAAARALQELWETKPGTVVLLCLGFVLSLVLVIDTWRYRRRRKRPR